MQKSRILAALAMGMSMFMVHAAVASAAQNPFCLPGSGAGQCNNPQGVATDFETGHVYVADRGNDRVDAFLTDGTSAVPSSFGSGQLENPTWVAVDNDATSASRHDVWVTTEKGAGDELLVKKFKPDGTYIKADSFGEPSKEGTGACEFKANDPIWVGPGGNVYVADSYDKDGKGSGQIFVNRVIVFEPVGRICLGEVGGKPLFEAEFQTIRNVAVDSTGHIYVTVAGAAGVIRKYSPTGTFEYELEGIETEGIAVDSADHLFAKQRVGQKAKSQLISFFTEYAPATPAILRRFGYYLIGNASIPGLAAFHSGEGDLYASQGAEGVKYLKLPPPGPVVVPEPCRAKVNPGNAFATLQAEVNPEGKATTFEYEYLTQKKFEEEGNVFKNAQSSPEVALGGAADFVLHEAAQKVEGLEAETVYHCRVVAKNADGSSIPGQEGTFKTAEGFEFGGAWSSHVGETTATVFVEGNPHGLAATGQIEYVTDAQYQAGKFKEALSAPTPELKFGTTEEMVLQSANLSGLAPGTLYHYRLRARNGLPPEGIVCPEHKAECPELEHTFRTFSSESPEADQRRYELVSPGQKNSAEVAVPGNAAGFVEPRSIQIQAGAGDGHAVTYTSWTSFGAAQGAPATSQYLSKRTEAGWATENISPFGFIANTLFPPYVGFSADLTFGAFKTREPPLVSGCRKSEGIYLRDNETGVLHCLNPEVPGSPVAACLVYAGANEDGSRAFLAGKPEGGENFTYGLYEWTEEGGVQLISILPNGEPAPATNATAFGPGGNSFSGAEGCQVTRTILRHAISADGSRAFWTFVPKESEAKPSQLLVRVNAIKTEQLDKKQSGGAGEGEGVFLGANAEGSIAYFTDTEKLIVGAKAETGKPDLYRYEVGRTVPLSDLTAAGPGPGDVKGVVGISDDGSYVYFVAGGALAPGAVEGANNLYLLHEGATRFIAALANDDAGDWSSEPRQMSARVSPNGLHLAFLSIEAQKLASYENRIATGEHCKYSFDPNVESGPKLTGSPLCPQAFLYDAESEELSCASCNPSGSLPLGPTIFPGWSNGFEGPRFLSDDGKRLFFASLDGVLPADTNGRLDVYEFERSGAGSCSAANPNFDAVSGGCHFLVSSGRSADESYLVDASADGRDVFFSTRQPLVGWDLNDQFDVYDYREGGGFPEPPPALICEGEASCKPPATAPPQAPASATQSFNGPGNPKHKKHKKHKKKHSKGKKHTKGKKQSKKRRAAR